MTNAQGWIGTLGIDWVINVLVTSSYKPTTVCSVTFLFSYDTIFLFSVRSIAAQWMPFAFCKICAFRCLALEKISIIPQFRITDSFVCLVIVKKEELICWLYFGVKGLHSALFVLKYFPNLTSQAVAKISGWRVYAISRWETQQLGIFFGSIFLLFAMTVLGVVLATVNTRSQALSDSPYSYIRIIRNPLLPLQILLSCENTIA